MCDAVAAASGTALLQLHLVFRNVCREFSSEECVCFTALLSALLALLRAEKKRNSQKPVALRRAQACTRRVSGV